MFDGRRCCVHIDAGYMRESFPLPGGCSGPEDYRSLGLRLDKTGDFDDLSSLCALDVIAFEIRVSSITHAFGWCPPSHCGAEATGLASNVSIE